MSRKQQAVVMARTGDPSVLSVWKDWDFPQRKDGNLLSLSLSFTFKIYKARVFIVWKCVVYQIVSWHAAVILSTNLSWYRIARRWKLYSANVIQEILNWCFKYSLFHGFSVASGSGPLFFNIFHFQILDGNLIWLTKTNFSPVLPRRGPCESCGDFSESCGSVRSWRGLIWSCLAKGQLALLFTWKLTRCSVPVTSTVDYDSIVILNINKEYSAICSRFNIC